MKLALAALALAGCGGGVNDDLVPTALQDQLVFHEQTIQLQPDDTAPAFTMKVPLVWEQDRALVGEVDGRERLVNGGGGLRYDGFDANTEWGDPELHDGHFSLGILCPDVCGDTAADKIFASWRKDNHVLDETRTATEHAIVLENDEDRHYAIRAWRVAGDTRYRVCWVSIGKRYAKAYRAFVKACADAVEHDR